MSLSDSRQETLLRLLFPAVRRGFLPAPVGSLRFLNQSVDARRPQPPRRVRHLHALVSFGTDTGFTIFGRLATLD
jgi:hypothetical protein